jgi:hypothetical protein
MNLFKTPESFKIGSEKHKKYLACCRKLEDGEDLMPCEQFPGVTVRKITGD